MHATTQPRAYASAPTPVAGADPTALAFAFLTSLAGELSNGKVNLPSFPQVVFQVRKVFEDPDSSAEQLVRVIGAEPILATKILAISNSAAFVKSGRPITDLRNAVTRMGQQMLMSTVMAFALQELQKAPALKPIAGDLAKLWKHSVTVAAISQILSSRTKCNRDEVMFAGLVSSIGRLYILARSTGEPRLADNAAFMDMVADWHPSIGKSVLENWDFAESVSTAVGAQLEYDRAERHTPDLTDILVASVALAEVFKGPRPCKFTLSADITAFKSLALSLEDCEKVIAIADNEVQELQRALGF
jgi:HD-like signal output (HDOD) protein